MIKGDLLGKKVDYKIEYYKNDGTEWAFCSAPTRASP